MAGALEVQNRILEVAGSQFFNLGFTKVTMDEIAHELGMSKRTLYQISEGLGKISQSNETPFGKKLEQALSLVATEIPHFSPIFLRDIQRHAPEVWQELDQRRQEHIRTRFGQLIREGVKEGFLRKDINADVLVLLFLTLIRGVVNPETLSHLPLSAPQAFSVISGVLFEGILTDKGRAQYRKKES
jgi:hypothetical protein